MAKKSVTQRFAQTVKRLASKAAKATRKALEPDKRRSNSRRRMVYPLAADGFVSDPMLYESMPKAKPAKRRATKTSRKPARKTARKSTSTRSSAVTKKRKAARGR